MPSAFFPTTSRVNDAFVQCVLVLAAEFEGTSPYGRGCADDCKRSLSFAGFDGCFHPLCLECEVLIISAKHSTTNFYTLDPKPETLHTQNPEPLTLHALNPKPLSSSPSRSLKLCENGLPPGSCEGTPRTIWFCSAAYFSKPRSPHDAGTQS